MTVINTHNSKWKKAFIKAFFFHFCSNYLKQALGAFGHLNSSKYKVKCKRKCYVVVFLGAFVNFHSYFQNGMSYGTPCSKKQSCGSIVEVYAKF